MNAFCPGYLTNSNIPVNSGDQITFGGWVYLESGGSSWQPGWWLGARDANQNAIAWITPSPAAGSGWTYQSGTYTVPPSGVAYIWLYATVWRNTSTTAMRVDDGFLTIARLSLSVVDSLDYLPFGEQIAGDTGTTHKFTGKERDSESGLDNFGARYDSSQYGRFMTPDPLLNSGRPWDPQTWNRYAYARNNPLLNVDPTGLYDLDNTCATDDTKCNKQFNQHAQDLKNGLANLQKQADKVKDPVQKARLEGALRAFGTQGDNNGVNVSFGAVANGAAQTDPVYNQQTGQETYNVTMDPSKIGSQNDYAVDAAHEGTHVSDISGELANPSLGVLSPFSLEYRGYQTSAFAASALGMGSISFNYDGRSSVIWNGSWGAVDRNITNFVTRFHDQNGTQTHPETTPHNPWPN